MRTILEDAGGVLLLLLTSINRYREGVKINKKQAKLLANRAEDINNHLESLVTHAEKRGLEKNHPAYTVIEAFKQDFKQILIRIKNSMKQWEDLSFISRAWPKTKNEMQDEIALLGQELLDSWNKFMNCMQMYDLTLTAQIGSRLDHIEESLEKAREEDAKSDGITIANTALTVELLRRNDQRTQNLLEMNVSLREAIENLKQPPSSPPEDPSLIEARERLIKALQSYKGDSLPTGIDSSELTLPFSGKPYREGVYTEIHKGYRNGELVAIKRLRFSELDQVDTLYRRIRSEAKLWSRLDHPNITKFLGCCKPADNLVFMVSSWATHEDAFRYLIKNPDADFLKIMSVKPQPIIYANLRGGHVLIDSNWVAQLNDFGISFMADESYYGSREPPVNWSSLEELSGEDPTIESDIFSFALTFIELLTLKKPYAETGIGRSRMLQREILNGLRPAFPGPDYAEKGLTSTECPIWVLLEKCWDQDIAKRPKIDEVLEVLAKVRNEA
ncbi:hypothetical protein FRC03_010924 [Tulasnella sp. 419]|nr:hypothetical protein FRC03_010924 [Tulasnella sp. 419]